MISCLVIDEVNLSEQIKSYLLNDVFKKEDMEHIHLADNKILIFVNNIEKVKVWQVVFKLEVERILVGYGFGKQKEEAKDKALQRLKMLSYA